ncbi:MAG: RNase P subunit p30 family protein [Archaeoglobales archaeon]|nr:RNase P subunit p30 family protein [Archaeoglobales archaeon]
MYDFLRFFPENLPDLGFKGYVFLTEKGCGVVVRASTPRELREKLKNVREDVIVAVEAKNPEVCREAVMRKKVDIILDSVERELDYATIKLAAEKDVAIELGLSKFLKTRGALRVKLFEQLMDEIFVIKKFRAPFIISSAAENFWELRSRKQIENFFSFFGCNVKDARSYAERLVRRYYDPNYIMDGFEVLE